MTTIESKKVEVNNSQENIFNFLTDFNNFERLMPHDKISNWTSSADECSFSINGMATIGMKIIEKNPYSKIKITSSSGKNPFSFTLTVNIDKIGENKSITQIIFTAELNTFLKMMVEKPMANFLNMLVEQLRHLKDVNIA